MKDKSLVNCRFIAGLLRIDIDELLSLIKSSGIEPAARIQNDFFIDGKQFIQICKLLRNKTKNFNLN